MFRSVLPTLTCFSSLILQFANSIAFILYTFVLALINLYSSSGRNAATSNTADNNIEMNPRSFASKWYARVPIEPESHVVGEEEEEEED
jgi:hypothetical protein